MHLMMLTDCFTILIVNREHDATVHNYYIWGPPSDCSAIVPVVSGAYSNLFEELSIILSFHYHLDFIIVTHIACSYKFKALY